MCLYPKLIENRKYKSNKKNGGIIPAITDERTLYVPVGCGNCIECRKQQARQWQVRLNEEIKSDNKAYFMTMTFSEESLDKLTTEVLKSKRYSKKEVNEIATIAVRRFLERWRKEYKKSIKHWLITELGHTGTERIHIHGLIWTDKPQEIERIWQYGFVDTGQYVNEKTINYIVKYVNKLDKDHKGYKSKILTSPGIGKGYLNRIDKKLNEYKGKETKEYYKTPIGLKVNLPIYYRNKIYTEEQREQLWINKLDKNEIWICGEKLEANSQSEERTRKYYQMKNKRLGYGDDSEEWECKLYRKLRKRLNKMKRQSRERN